MVVSDFSFTASNFPSGMNTLYGNWRNSQLPSQEQIEDGELGQVPIILMHLHGTETLNF